MLVELCLKWLMWKCIDSFYIIRLFDVELFTCVSSCRLLFQRVDIIFTCIQAAKVTKQL